MSDHDLDLITELISGRLSPEERRAALTRVAADPELQSEYETQLTTASLLQDAPVPTMTATERSNLRATLRQQLHLDDAPTPVAPAPSRWQRWWAPITGLAAAAAVVVGAVVILPDSDTDDSLQFAAAEVTSTVQASRGDEVDTGSSADSVGSIEEEQTTTAASEELIPPAAAEDGITGTLDSAGAASPRSIPHLPDVDLDQLGLAYARGADEFANELDKSAERADPVESSEVNACLDGSGNAAEEASLSIVATATIGGVDVVVLSVIPSTGDPYLVALDVATCRELASTRP
jgi:hypothetical protein